MFFNILAQHKVGFILADLGEITSDAGLRTKFIERDRNSKWDRKLELFFRKEVDRWPSGRHGGQTNALCFHLTLPVNLSALVKKKNDRVSTHVQILLFDSPSPAKLH